MTDIDKRINEINHKIRDAYYAKQITADATGIINELGAISKALQAQVVEREQRFSAEEIEDMGEYAGIEPDRLEAALSYMYDKRQYLATINKAGE